MSLAIPWTTCHESRVSVRLVRSASVTPTIALFVLVGVLFPVAALARTSPPSPCWDKPKVEGWVTATIVAKDPRTEVCAPLVPTPGPAGDSCILPTATFCLGGEALLVIDEVEHATTARTCGLAPGTHMVSYCGVECGAVVVTSSSTTEIHVSKAEPRLTVRIERVFEGDAALRGQVIEGTMTQRTYPSLGGELPGHYLIQDLAVGQEVELWWPPGIARNFTWLPACHPDLRGPSGAPGCARCDSGTHGAGTFALVLLVLLRKRGA